MTQSVGLNTSTHKFYGRTRYPNLILEKGITDNNALFQWYKETVLEDNTIQRKNGNKKLFRIKTLDGYKGKLWGEICVGITEKEMLAIESGFVYDEMEEVWESQKGVFIEMDAEKNTVMGISI